MTMTSQAYSLSPTSTLASSSPTATDNGGDSFYDIFSSGSPPLIMTFLSLGLFIVAMTGVFGWRRLSRSRGQEPQPIVRPNHKSTSPCKRPILCDVWTDLRVQEKSEIKTMGWEIITPMTAILTVPVPPVRSLVEPLMPIKSIGVRWMVRHLVSGVKRLYLPPLPPEPDKNEAIPLTSITSDTIEWGDTSSLQISVIITMPTKRRCGSGTSAKDVDPDRMELGEFCIGTTDVP